jgi:hypothetical protein
MMNAENLIIENKKSLNDRVRAVSVFRNLSAIRFIRCTMRIPGTSINAGGAGFTLQGALVRCQSELIERTFELHELHPNGIYPAGIAAHPDSHQALALAQQEAIETLCVRQIAKEGKIQCVFTLSFLSLSIGIARTEKGYFCVIRGKLHGIPVGTSSAGPRMFSTLLKTWEEFSNLRFFKPSPESLRTYTRMNHTFSQQKLRDLKFYFRPSAIYKPLISALRFYKTERSGRKIVYLINPEGE